MPLEIIVREYTDSDLWALNILEAQLGYKIEYEEFARRVLRQCQYVDFGIVVAEINENIVGFAAYQKMFALEYEYPVLHIIGFAVAEQYRRRGIGRYLLSDLEKKAKFWKCSTLYLTSGNRPEREAAHRFYKNCGFAGTGTKFVKNIP